MATFDDSTDPELGAACSRLAAWVEHLAEGLVIDPASGLTERDLALILWRLHATRRDEQGGATRANGREGDHGRASVPITAKG